MENDNKTEQEKIKDLVKTIEEMHLQEPYKTQTYNQMLARILGGANQMQPIQSSERRANKPKVKRQSSKVGRGNKSDILVRIEALFETDFFNNQKTMREIQEKLREQGYNIDLPQLSPRLLFFVRNGKLARTKNDEGRFVYSKNNFQSGLQAGTSETSLSS